MTTQPIVFVVDDDPAVRDSLSELGRAAGFDVQGYASAEEVLESIDPQQPGCIVLDVRMPGMSGLDLQKELVAANIYLPVIIVTGHGDVPMSVRALKMGAVEFLEKPFRPEQLVGAIQSAIQLDAGKRSKRMIRIDAEHRMATLSEEEQRVMIGLVEGRTNNEIAKQLDISLRTVQFRRSSIMNKLNISSKYDMVQIVRRAGWLEGASCKSMQSN